MWQVEQAELAVYLDSSEVPDAIVCQKDAST